MPDLDLFSLFADAYGFGQIIGVLVRWGVLLGGGLLVIRRMRGGQGRGPRSRPGQVVALAVVIAGIGYSIHYDFFSGPSAPVRGSAPVAQVDGEWLRGARAGMASTCREQGQTPSFCNCYADEIMRRTGTRAHLETMVAEMQARPADSQPPVIVAATIDACA